MINEARTLLRGAPECGEPVLIVEDLDKATMAEADRLFVNNPAILSGLPIKAIFTAPIFLLYNYQAVALDQDFKQVTFPMIKTRDPDGERFAPGWETIRAILDQRIDPSADLVEEDALNEAIERTGGVLRHLFEALQNAAEAAEEAFEEGRRDTARIEGDDVRWGLNQVKNRLLQRIGVGMVGEIGGITTRDLYDRLRLLSGKSQQVGSELVNLLLMHSQALIEYNGERWHRIHPLVEEHLRDTKPLEPPPASDSQASSEPAS